MYKVNYKRFTVFVVLVLFFSFCSFSLANYLSGGKRTHPKKIYNASKKIEQKNLPTPTTDNIKLKYENRNLSIAAPIYIVHNRYYIPLADLIKNTGLGKIHQSGHKIKIQLNNKIVTIDTVESSYFSGAKSYQLKKKIILSKDRVYISLFDLSKIFDFKTYWDLDNKTIGLYLNREKSTIKPQSKGKYALVRLEDVSVEGHYSTANDLEKLRVITDYLYQENIPFHVAWIPRYIDPRPGINIDNDLSKKDNIYNADFIFTLDYMKDHDGLIGLHGYTHQHGNQVSINATEFHSYPKDNIPDTEQYIQERIDQAKQSAKDLDIPYSFFEAPHYAFDAKRYNLLEKNFDYIYQPYVGNPFYDKVVVRKYGSRTVRYIPTPLDYTNGKADINKILHRIDNLKPGVVGSFFFHPVIDFNDIIITRDKTGYPTYIYHNNSPLHLIIKELHNKGYSFVTINDIKQ